MWVSDKDLSAAGGVGQGTLRPTDKQRAALMLGNRRLSVPASARRRFTLRADLKIYQEYLFNYSADILKQQLNYSTVAAALPPCLKVANFFFICTMLISARLKINLKVIDTVSDSEVYGIIQEIPNINVRFWYIY